jgi:hypothetical protein
MTTHADIPGYGRVWYFFAEEEVTVHGLRKNVPTLAGESRVYNWYSGELCGDSDVVKPGYEGHVFALVVPTIGRWLLLGEVGKFVALSSTRFPKVSHGNATVEATVAGVSGEVVHVCAVLLGAETRCCLEARFGHDSVQTLVFPSPSCLSSDEMSAAILV